MSRARADASPRSAAPTAGNGLALAFVLALAALLRGYHLTAPLLGTNSWRQCDNAAIARNYVERDDRFAWPQVDWGGAGPGYVQGEFPILPWTVSRLYRFTGVWEPWGRLLAALCSLAGIWALARLVDRVAGPPAGGWAACCVAIWPLSVYYGRAFMIESPMLLALTGGLLAFDVWLERGGGGWFLLSAAATALAVLLKPVSLYVGLPLLVLARARFGTGWWRKPSLWGYAALVMLPAAGWYVHAQRIFDLTGLTLMGDWRYGTDKWGNWALLGSWSWWNRIVFQRLAEKHLTWFGFALLVWALFDRGPRPTGDRDRWRARVFPAWLIAVLIYCMIATRGAFEHEHYELPFVLPAAALIGMLFARYFPEPLFYRRPPRLQRKGRVRMALRIMMGGMIALSVGQYERIMHLENRRLSSAWQVANVVGSHSEADALVVFINNNDPTVQYYAHRRGWPLHVNTLVDTQGRVLADRVRAGARYVAGSESDFTTPAAGDVLKVIRRRYKTMATDGGAFLLRLPGPTP